MDTDKEGRKLKRFYGSGKETEIRRRRGGQENRAEGVWRGRRRGGRGGLDGGGGMPKEPGGVVLGLVTLPFEFEGNRRQRQAQSGLRELKAEADGVICLPNQKVFKLIDENTSVPEALKITNELLAQGVRGIWRLLTQTGMINVDFNDLCARLRGRHEESSLATVEASSENRSHEVIEKLMTHPFLECGQVLAEADAVLVASR